MLVFYGEARARNVVDSVRTQAGYKTGIRLVSRNRFVAPPSHPSQKDRKGVHRKTDNNFFCPGRIEEDFSPFQRAHACASFDTTYGLVTIFSQ